MSTHFEELGDLLASHLEAARNTTLDEDRIDQAQARLMERITQAGPAARERRRTLRSLAWAAPAAVIVTLATALFVGGPVGPGSAFAAAQAYFMDFRTLHAQQRMSVMGQPVMEMDIYVERGGRARIDMAGEVTHLVDPTAGRMVTLLHPSRTAQRVDLASDEHGHPDELDWLREIRTFQGQAEPLSTRKTIDGRLANGFRWTRDQLVLTLWAAADDNQPLRLLMRGAGQGAELMEMQLDFRFDPVLADGLFEVELPAGYRWIGAAETP